MHFLGAIGQSGLDPKALTAYLETRSVDLSGYSAVW